MRLISFMTRLNACLLLSPIVLRLGMASGGHQALHKWHAGASVDSHQESDDMEQAELDASSRLFEDHTYPARIDLRSRSSRETLGDEASQDLARRDGQSHVNTPSCPADNGTVASSSTGVSYVIICDTNYLGTDSPLLDVPDYPSCLQKCDAVNANNKRIVCLAALFVPGINNETNECYLKRTIAVTANLYSNNIIGGIRLPSSLESKTSHSDPSSASSSSAALGVSTRSQTPTPLSSSISTKSRSYSGFSTASISRTTSAGTKLSSGAPQSTQSHDPSFSASPHGSGPGITFASSQRIIIPVVASVQLHGPSNNVPSKQYLDYKSPEGIKLDASLLTIGVNGKLSTDYDISLQTGVLGVNLSSQAFLSSLVETPHLSRDGGQGGMVNGQHLFVFCDTGSYTTTTNSQSGKFLGFVSSSVAIDVGMNGLKGQALSLQDGIGEWSDKNGRMRGFAPLTQGEQAYNQVVQGNGQRYAVWPESPIITIDDKTGVIFAPIVYDNVDRRTGKTVFTYTGATLLKITANDRAGPRADRIVSRMFLQDEIEWGCAGGIRSWGSSGVGGSDGYVYIFGGVQHGILLARTAPATVAVRSSYEFWNGHIWTSQILDKSSQAFFIKGSFMDSNVFYSPRHLTFIIVYLTAYADSTFYYRYLKADHPIFPPFATSNTTATFDYVENILKYEWSEEHILYKAAAGLSGRYIYAGAAHEGYFGANDIINGGTKMLLSWTAPTGQDPSSINSEYQIVTAAVTFE